MSEWLFSNYPLFSQVQFNADDMKVCGFMNLGTTLWLSAKNKNIYAEYAHMSRGPLGYVGGLVNLRVAGM